MMERLQKVIANAGITSRRKAEQLIIDGRVRVNHQIVKELGTKVSFQDIVEVDDIPIEKQTKSHTFLFYKPRGVISSVKDEKDRKTVTSFFEDFDYRLYPVGRLDYDTSGLILMTNDGDLANGLMHPRNKVDKVYVAKIAGFLTKDEIRQLQKGVVIDGKKTSPAKVKVISSDSKKKTSIVRLTIHEGRNHQVKNMFKAVGHPVDKLSREQYAFLDQTSLVSGKYRELSRQEVAQLKELIVK
nr:pseudouridine synthase [Holzapfeliella floricola]